MKASTYVLYFIKDFIITLLVVIAAAVLLMMLFADSGLNVSIALQLAMAALGINFARYGLVQKYAETKNQEVISFFVHTSLAVVVLIFWLHFISANGFISIGNTVIFIIIYILMKIVVFNMMRKDARDQAKELNQKFDELKKSN